MHTMSDQDTTTREPFARWLLSRPERRNWTDELVKVAKADRTFPKAGDVEAVRNHLEKLGADGDMFERVDDAELDYLSH